MPPQPLSDDQIMALRRLLAIGVSPRLLAQALGINAAALIALKEGRPWRALVKPCALGDLFDDPKLGDLFK